MPGAAEFGTAVALETDQRLVDAVDHLTANPQLGRRGRVAGTRDLVAPVTPFLVIYRYDAEPAPGVVEAVEVVHHSAAVAGGGLIYDSRCEIPYHGQRLKSLHSRQ